ncbi:MAG: ATP-dependent helicase [Ferruginibacter sp.]
MVETRLTLEPEVQAVLACVDSGNNFLLSGGAGSGKTYSLVQVIRQVIKENPTSKIACMTYTNAAVKEIEERVNHSNLNVSTIHDFLWDCIKHFQKELKLCLVGLLNDVNVTQIKIETADPITDTYFDHLEKGIQYKEFLRLQEGIISHDELLILANRLFEQYPKLSWIVKDKYKFILVDEYQDTNKEVVKIFLDHFKLSDKKNIIGFFGDAMQSIYDDGIGNLDEYKGENENKVKEVKKTQNRRNPANIIKLANLLRTDGIEQVPSEDANAPNMDQGHIKEGNAKFIYSNNPDFKRVTGFLDHEYGWECSNPKRTKELNLTHNLIADKAEFRALMNIYDGDGILDYRYRIKTYIKNRAVVEDFSNYTFRQVIDFLKAGKTGAELRAVNPTPTMQEFIDSHAELYQTALDSDYATFSKLYIDKDQLLDDKKQNEDDENKKGSKRDNLIRHLFKIQTNISLYTNKQYNEFLRLTDFRNKIVNIESKRQLKQHIESLINVGEKTIEEIINEANETGICIIDQSLTKFIEEKQYVYNQVKAVKFKEFQKLFEYLEGYTPYSTQHKTKGREFDTVLVILDNGRWNKYNFENLFLNNGTPSVLIRTQKIFYVCCTRAKENLAVFYHDPKPEVVTQAKQWFGEEHVINLDS